MLGAFLALCVTAGITAIYKNPKNLEYYEEDFWIKHRLAPTETVELSFKHDQQKLDHFMNLCTPFVRKRKLRKHPPHVETHYFGFKVDIHHPYKIELIRCSDKVALIESGTYHCAYVLRKGKRSKHYIGVTGKKDKHFPGLIFHIYAKIRYRKDASAEVQSSGTANVISNELPPVNQPQPPENYGGTMFAPDGNPYYPLREQYPDTGMPYPTHYQPRAEDVKYSMPGAEQGYRPAPKYHPEIYPVHEPHPLSHDDNHLRRRKPAAGAESDPLRYPPSHFWTYQSGERPNDNDLRPTLSQP